MPKDGFCVLLCTLNVQPDAWQCRTQSSQARHNGISALLTGAVMKVGRRYFFALNRASLPCLLTPVIGRAVQQGLSCALGVVCLHQHCSAQAKHYSLGRFGFNQGANDVDNFIGFSLINVLPFNHRALK